MKIEQIKVVAGLILQNNKLLICQRPNFKDHPLKWEFPGGKIKNDENNEEALIREINDWNRGNIQNVINDFLKNNKIKFPVLGKPIRFLLINSYQGPSISDIFVILGKKDTIDRLNQYRGN